MSKSTKAIAEMLYIWLTKDYELNREAASSVHLYEPPIPSEEIDTDHTSDD